MGTPAGVGMDNKEMTALSKHIGEVVADRILTAVVEKYGDVETGHVMIPIGEIVDAEENN